MADQPAAYRELVAMGWRWARVDHGTPHLVPPHGDMALCMRACERPRRTIVTSGIALAGCRRCMDRAGIQAPEQRATQLELPARRDTYPGQ